MVKFKEAEERMFKNVFVCKKCGTKIRAKPVKVKLNEVRCRRCGYKYLRAKRKEKAKK